MANEILAALPLSRNDVSTFANLIQETLEAYGANYSALEREYWIALRTLIGLGFTAFLVCEEGVPACTPYLITFLRHRKYTRKKGAPEQVALAVAEMVNAASHLFKIIRYPRYYEDFVVALKHIAYQMRLTLCERAGEVERLIKLILGER